MLLLGAQFVSYAWYFTVDAKTKYKIYNFYRTSEFWFKTMEKLWLNQKYDRWLNSIWYTRNWIDKRERIRMKVKIDWRDDWKWDEGNGLKIGKKREKQAEA